MLVELKQVSGYPVQVNPSHVVTVTARAGGEDRQQFQSVVTLVIGDDLLIDESASAIRQKINLGSLRS